MLSILIPVFNDDIRALVSTVHQQVQKAAIPYEILWIDDASTQTNISEKNLSCSKYATSYQAPKNKGRTASRQFLAQKAQYNWLLFLDADVLPLHADFIAQFIPHLPTADLIFGGIAYSSEPPKPAYLLRWKYGRIREAKPLNKRQKHPYNSIISGALCIKKELFLAVNPIEYASYGLDALLVQRLKDKKATVLHINNPAVHLGIETNPLFLKKTRAGLKTLVQLEKTQQIGNQYRPVQKAYTQLKKKKLLKLFSAIYKLFKNVFYRRLINGGASLFLFDMYKLACYIDLQKE